MGNDFSSMTDVELLGDLSNEAKRRGLLVSIPVSENSIAGRLEPVLGSLSKGQLEELIHLVTRRGHVSNFGLQNAILKEAERRNSHASS